MSVVTRFPPSPSGSLHFGSIFTSFISKLYAIQNNGKFLLRIENTDEVRSTIEFENAIYDSLKWLGLNWDGFVVRQSERLKIYEKYAESLVQNGNAFYCFCTKERLDDMRINQIAKKQQAKYDGCCSKLTEQEIQGKLDSNTPYVIRMKIPDTGICVVQDMILGEIEFDYKNIDSQVLLKNNKSATYFLASVVDDFESGVNYVIRGSDWLPSANKIVLLYNYFGWVLPKFLHLPLLRNTDTSKLSKRENHSSIDWFRREGFLPEAILNYLYVLANPVADGENEIFNVWDRVSDFDISKINITGPVVSIDKIKFYNKSWLSKLDADDVTQRVIDYTGINHPSIHELVSLAIPRASTLNEIRELLGPFFGDVSGVQEIPKMDANLVSQILSETVAELEVLVDWNKINIETLLKTTSSKMNIKLRHFTKPFYYALYGEDQGLPLFEGLVLLGKQESLTRIRNWL